ncbi:glycoside hydrolase family 88/105 protein [Lacticaseibacillus jixiensis]|uniref:glycoside hydrolase family 88/105 protein n=1 Tax=Lacticaseibacillus jixiensis TaxID=3231926 RepID=UPI0036F3269E
MKRNLDEIDDKLHLVIEQLIHLKAAGQHKYDDLSEEDRTAIGVFSRDFGMGHWDWPQGVGLFGLSYAGPAYEHYICSWARRQTAAGLPIPNVNTMCPMQTLMDYPEFEPLTNQWLITLLNDLPRTNEDGIEHTTTGNSKDKLHRNQNQIWADTMFMAVLFIAKMARKYHRNDWQAVAHYQVLLHLKYLLDRPTGLFYHGWDFTRRSNFNGLFWCRGNAWMTMAIPQYLNIAEASISQADKQYLQGVYRVQIDALMSLRDHDTGLWHTILNDSTSYIETSGSAGIVAGLLMGMQMGLLPTNAYRQLAEDAVASLLATIGEDGTVQGVSAGTPIGETAEHYKNIVIQPMAYGQAMMICALMQYKHLD